MKRRIFLCVITLCLPALALAQKPARVGLLGLGLEKEFRDAFVNGLREQGYSIGKNLTLLDQSTLQRYEMLAPAAAELVRTKADVIVTWGSTASRVAKDTTSTVPIVLVAGGDPVAGGIVKSLSRPGGNVTGIISLNSDLVGKHLELLNELSPGMRKVAVMLNPASANEVRYIPVAQAEARRLKLDTQVAEVRSPEDFDAAFAAAARAGCNGLYIVPSTMFFPHRQKIAALALKHGMASVSGLPEYADAGILVAHGANRSKMMRRAAAYTARVLKGENPAEMPIEQASEFELILNMKTAQALGLKVTEALRFRADRLVE